jgi:translation initiation factor 2B subunit (eIF-2B alpha/beta/delta family)
MENPIEEIIEIFQSKLSILNSEENLSQSLLTEHDKILMAYIQTVSHYIQNSKFTTIYGLYSSIEQVTESFIKKMIEKKIISKFDIAISLQAAGQVINHLLHKFISKKISEDLNVIQQYLINIINDLLALNKLSYEKINKFFDHTIRNGTKILVHGYSSHIIYSLIESSKKGKKFFVYITSSQPDDY